MSQFHKRITGLAALGILVGLLTFISLSVVSASRARADDATHSTALGLGTWNFGSGSVGAANGSFVSTDTLDVSWEIMWYITPSGGSSTFSGSSRTTRAAGYSGVSGAIGTAGLNSGDQVQAQFHSYDASGNSRFSFSRTVGIP